MTSLIIMGVSGCGKSVVGQALAGHLGWPFVEGDTLHGSQNVAKMSRGEALTDADRWPWLQRIGEQLSVCTSPAVISCSALRRVYRQHIIQYSSNPLAFIQLAAEQSVIAERMAVRQGHFMPATLLDSQFRTLEPLQMDEVGTVIDVTQNIESVIADSIRYAEILV